jgi:hypothetical protein
MNLKQWTRTHTLIAGLALLLATNAVALVGVAYNRSGEPDGTLSLTQRELILPYTWGLESENSGIALTVQWRVLPARANDPSDTGLSYAGGGVAEWLDEAKLSALGFDVTLLDDTVRGARFLERQLPREVLFVLELAGPAYEESLRRVREYAQREMALAAANPGKQEFKYRTTNARERLESEEQRETRLFIVDAGLAPAALRAAYPDRGRYAIVRGQVHPYIVSSAGKQRARGYVSELSIKQINVPHEFRPVFESLVREQRARTLEHAVRYTVTVTFGKRLEPWIIGAAAPAAN